MPRNVKACTQDARCGFCGLGCQTGAKQSTLKTYLQDAYEHRARVVVNCKVDQVLIEDGRAVGVRATVRQADMPAWTLVVRSRVVVAAAGAIGTPALLQRSAVRGKALGAHLRLHPGTAVAGIFEERLNPWEGTMQAIYSDQFINRDGQHHGVKIEYGPMHPAILALATPWRDPAHYNRLMRSLPHMSVAAPLVRDHHSGRVTAHQGSARVDYRLSREDVADVRQGIEASARIFEAGGALEIFTSQAAFVSYRPGQRGGLAGFMDEVDRRGYGPGIARIEQDRGVTDHLGHARVTEGGHRAPARHRLQAREPESFVAAREHEATGGRVQIGQLLVGHATKHPGVRHRRRGLPAWVSRDHQLQVLPDLPRRIPCAQEGGGVLARVESADE